MESGKLNQPDKDHDTDGYEKAQHDGDMEKAKGMDMTEYNADGEAEKGGGFYKADGKLHKMSHKMKSMCAEKGMAYTMKAMGMMHKGEYEESSVEKALDVDDLEKALDALEEIVLSDDPSARRNHLLEKAKSDDLTKSEHAELMDLLGGKSATPDLSEEITKGFVENEDLVKSIDVSNYLENQHFELVKALGVLGDAVEASDQRSWNLDIELAKSVSAIGREVVAMRKTLGTIAQAPARAPKSVTAGALEKGFAGANPAGEEITLSKAMNVMEEMLHKGVVTEGFDLVNEMTKGESTGRISSRALEGVKEYLASAR